MPTQMLCFHHSQMKQEPKKYPQAQQRHLTYGTELYKSHILVFVAVYWAFIALIIFVFMACIPVILEFIHVNLKILLNL